MTDDLKVVAYHEAGHAVAHFIFGMPLRYVTIMPKGTARGSTMGTRVPKYVRDWIDEGGDYLFGPVESTAARAHAWFERQVMILLAGEIAQEKATGTTEGSRVTIEHPEHGTVIVDGDWHSVIDMVDRMSYGDEDCGLYIEWLTARIRSLLARESYWVMVEAVAAALLDRRRLAGHEVFAIASTAHVEHVTKGRSVPLPFREDATEKEVG